MGNAASAADQDETDKRNDTCKRYSSSSSMWGREMKSCTDKGPKLVESARSRSHSACGDGGAGPCYGRARRLHHRSALLRLL